MSLLINVTEMWLDFLVRKPNVSGWIKFNWNVELFSRIFDKEINGKFKTI